MTNAPLHKSVGAIPGTFASSGGPQRSAELRSGPDRRRRPDDRPDPLGRPERCGGTDRTAGAERSTGSDPSGGSEPPRSREPREGVDRPTSAERQQRSGGSLHHHVRRLAEARQAATEQLRRRHPHMLIWYGEATGRYWCMPLEPEAYPRLLEAGDPAELAALLAEYDAVSLGAEGETPSLTSATAG